VIRRVVAVVATGFLLGFGSARADPDPAATAPGQPPDGAYEELLESFDEVVEVARENAPDELALVEAEEIAVIAEEFFAEGDSELALELLEEAIALLDAPEGG